MEGFLAYDLQQFLFLQLFHLLTGPILTPNNIKLLQLGASGRSIHRRVARSSLRDVTYRRIKLGGNFQITWILVQISNENE